MSRNGSSSGLLCNWISARWILCCSSLIRVPFARLFSLVNLPLQMSTLLLRSDAENTIWGKVVATLWWTLKWVHPGTWECVTAHHDTLSKWCPSSSLPAHIVNFAYTTLAHFANGNVTWLHFEYFASPLWQIHLGGSNSSNTCITHIMP